jgi:hypothetical protein
MNETASLSTKNAALSVAIAALSANQRERIDPWSSPHYTAQRPDRKHRHDYRDGDLCSVCDMPKPLKGGAR